MSMIHEHIPSLIATYIVSQKHTRYVVYRAAKKCRHLSSAILFIHILIPNLEILRYWIFYLRNGFHVTPTYLDFIVMVFHSWTSHYLVAKGHYAGHKHIAQPVFHAQMLLRLAISFFSVFLGFPGLHSATIKINTAASYPRILIWAVKRLNILPTYKDIYTAVMFVGSLLAMHDSGVWYGPQIFIGVWAGLCLLETWVAHEIVNKKAEKSLPGLWVTFHSLKNGLVAFLNRTGFINQCEFEKLRKAYKVDTQASDNDMYTEVVESGAKEPITRNGRNSFR